MADVNVQSTELDFTTIKDRLKIHFASKSQFADYNFEAAGLSNLLDVLAYNTHYNALTANFALNEAFLGTAQLRSSVVAHATTLGYNPRSRTASRATIAINVNLAGVAGRPQTISIPAGTTFTAVVGEISFVYQTLEIYYATDNGAGVYQFASLDGATGIPIYEGSSVTKTFFVGEVGERQLYVIPDKTIDTATAVVKVFDNTSTQAYTNYSPLSTAISVTDTSTYYQISEAPNQYYELNFGDGISFGKSPSAGNKIVVQYLSCLGDEANGATIFTPTSPISVLGNNYTLSVTTISQSAAGAVRQSIESIRANAPIAFAAQQRLVTAEDYKAIILQNYSAVTDAIAWGGEDNVPADYGKVYVGLVYADGVPASTQTIIKNNIIQNITNNLSIISIDTVFADPTITYMEVEIIFNFDPNLTGLTVKATEDLVVDTINTYAATELSKFGGIFRRSNLLSDIDNISEAILNSRANVRLQQRFEPLINTQQSYTINFPVALAQPSGTSAVVNTSTFRFDNKVCRIQNAVGSAKLQIVTTAGVTVIDNIGQFVPETGKIVITGFKPTSITSGSAFIKLSATPANQATVRPLRSYILKIDPSPTYASGVIDRQKLEVTL